MRSDTLLPDYQEDNSRSADQLQQYQLVVLVTQPMRLDGPIAFYFASIQPRYWLKLTSYHRYRPHRHQALSTHFSLRCSRSPITNSLSQPSDLIVLGQLYIFQLFRSDMPIKIRSYLVSFGDLLELFRTYKLVKGTIAILSAVLL